MLRSIGLIALLFALTVPGYARTDAVAAWRKEIVVRLSASKRFPAQAFGQAGTVVVGFVLDRNGKLVSSWLHESSGVPAFDEESLAVVKRAEPFPAPPPDLGEDGLKLFAPMIYSKLPRHPDTSADIGKIREILQGETQVESRMRSICRGC